MEHGVRKVDVHGEGPGLRPRDRHPLASRTPASRSPASRTSRRSRTTAAARPSGGGSDRHGSLHRPVCRLCRRERHEASSRAPSATDEVPDRAPPVPAGRARPHASPQRATASTCSSCGRSRRPAASTACSRSSSATLYDEANRQQGITGENLLRLLELRLDNVVFRAGWASSRTQARQFVRHGHVDGQRQAGHHPELPRAQGRRRRAARRRPATMIVIRHNLDTLDRSVAAVARGRRRRQAGHRARPPAARADRRARARAAHRRALLQVIRTPSHAERQRHTHARHPAPDVEADRRRRRQPPAVRRSARSSPASATRSATRCAARCCRRSPARPSPQVRFDDALHEFDTIAGVKEDVTDIILNLKDLVLTSTSRRAGHAAPRRARPGRRHRRRHPDAPPTSRSSTRTCTSPRSTPRAASPSTSPSSRAAATCRPTATRRHRTIGVDPGRRDLLAGAPGDVHDRADPRRAGHQLRPPRPRHRDRRLDHAPRRAGLGRRHAAHARRPRRRHERRAAGPRARRGRRRRAPARPTSTCRSRTSTCRSVRATASSGPRSTRSASCCRRPRTTCSPSPTSARSRSTRSCRSSTSAACRSAADEDVSRPCRNPKKGPPLRRRRRAPAADDGQPGRVADRRRGHRHHRGQGQGAAPDRREADHQGQEGRRAPMRRPPDPSDPGLPRRQGDDRTSCSTRSARATPTATVATLRILKLGPRQGDNAPMARIELVDRPTV